MTAWTKETESTTSWTSETVLPTMILVGSPVGLLLTLTQNPTIIANPWTTETAPQTLWLKAQ